MSYTYDVLRWLIAKKLKSFTHKDIFKATYANCSHSVLREFKKKLEDLNLRLDEIWETNTKEEYDPVKKKNIKVVKRYKRYFIVKKEKTA